MISKIMLGYDGSGSGERALEFATTLARKFGADLHVVAVVRPPEVGDDVETLAVVESARQRYEEMFDGVRAKLAAESLRTVFQVVTGHPAEQLVRYAEAHAIDHIVVGHRGHTLFERWLIGSVARQVIAYAHCAVTVVRVGAA